MAKPTLYLMLGYPGAGKTTTAEVVSKLTGAIHLSSDQFRLTMFPRPRFTPEEHSAVYGALDYLTELLLSKDVSVIYDANLNRYQHRHEKYLICHKVGALPELLWVQTDHAIAKRRAVHQSRDHLVPAYEAPEVMFERIASILEPPHPEEPAVNIDGTRVDETYIQSQLKI